MLPAENVVYSPPGTYMNISTGLCSHPHMQSRVHLTFAKPVYLVYTVGLFDSYSFSVTYNNSFGESVTYMNMDGIYVRSK